MYIVQVHNLLSTILKSKKLWKPKILDYILLSRLHWDATE